MAESSSGKQKTISHPDLLGRLRLSQNILRAQWPCTHLSGEANGFEGDNPERHFLQSGRCSDPGLRMADSWCWQLLFIQSHQPSHHPGCQPSGPLGYSPKPLFWSQRPRQCSEQPRRDEIFAVKSQLRDAENRQTQPSAAPSVTDMVAFREGGMMVCSLDSPQLQPSK